MRWNDVKPEEVSCTSVSLSLSVSLALAHSLSRQWEVSIPLLLPEAPYPLAIQPHVLCVALSAGDLMPVLDEDADGLCVTKAIAAGKTLTGREEIETFR